MPVQCGRLDVRVIDVVVERRGVTTTAKRLARAPDAKLTARSAPLFDSTVTHTRAQSSSYSSTRGHSSPTELTRLHDALIGQRYIYTSCRLAAAKLGRLVTDCLTILLSISVFTFQFVCFPC